MKLRSVCVTPHLQCCDDMMNEVTAAAGTIQRFICVGPAANSVAAATSALSLARRGGRLKYQHPDLSRTEFVSPGTVTRSLRHGSYFPVRRRIRDGSCPGDGTPPSSSGRSWLAWLAPLKGAARRLWRWAMTPALSLPRPAAATAPVLLQRPTAG